MVEQRKGLKPLSTMRGYKAFTDTPLEVDLWLEHYPNSLFIDTYRGLSDWLKSVKGHCKRYRKDFNKYKCADSWYAWREMIEDKFLGKDNFLSIAICHGEEWDKLCAFLEVPVPPVEFPHANKNGR
jgi:hypothetical protein